MRLYLTYTQSPELQALASSADRDRVHTEAWAELRRDRPQLWIRSFGIVMVFGVLGYLSGVMLNGVLSEFGSSLRMPLAWFSGLCCGAAALLHVHLMAAALRPIYARIIANGIEKQLDGAAPEGHR